MRECGECTACCDGWLTSRHLAMRPGFPCEHRTDEGCAIYAQRPNKPCKEFKCVWLQREDGLEDEMRPDRSGAIMFFRAWKNWNPVLNLMPVGKKIPSKTLERAKDFASEQGIPIVWSERVEDYVADDTLAVKATGPSEFMIQIKWDFMEDDIWSSGDAM